MQSRYYPYIYADCSATFRKIKEVSIIVEIVTNYVLGSIFQFKLKIFYVPGFAFRLDMTIWIAGRSQSVAGRI